MAEFFSIDNFKNYFEGGARAYLFKWEPVISEGAAGCGFNSLGKDTMLVKATSLPESSVEEHIIEYQQINFKMAGKKIFNDWQVSFVMNKSGSIRLAFEKWMNKIHNINSNSGPFEHKYFDNYKAQMTFKMLDYGGILGINSGDTLLEVTLYNAWPKTIGAITLDYSSQDFAQFDVTFSYQYHYMKDSNV